MTPGDIPRCAKCGHLRDGVGDMCKYGWCRCVCTDPPAPENREIVNENGTRPPCGDALAADDEHVPGQDVGSRVVSVGPVTIGCMARDSRAALDLAMARWRSFDAWRDPKPDDPVYSFAYWLFRWSGIVTGVNLAAPENPWEPKP